MKKIILSAALVSCFFLNAQEDSSGIVNYKTVKLGVKGGLSLPSLSDNSDNKYTENFKSFASFEGGIFMNYGITDKLSAQIEFNYSKKGGERSGMQPIPASFIESNLPPDQEIPPDIDFYADFNNRNELQYFEIPLLAKFTIGDEWRFFANAGPYFGFLMKATQVTSGSSEIYFDENREILLFPETSFDAETDVKDSINEINFGGILGIGVTKDIGSKSELLFEVRGTFGFIPLQKDEKFGKSRVGSVLFSFGYVYRL